MKPLIRFLMFTLPITLVGMTAIAPASQAKPVILGRTPNGDLYAIDNSTIRNYNDGRIRIVTFVSTLEFNGMILGYGVHATCPVQTYKITESATYDPVSGDVLRRETLTLAAAEAREVVSGSVMHEMVQYACEYRTT